MNLQRSVLARPEWAGVIESRVKAGLVPGIVATAAYPERTECWTAGYQDIAGRIPMQRNTLFRLASVSKVVTAISAMILVDEGLIGLDEPLDEWLPEISGRPVIENLYGSMADVSEERHSVSLRHLLSMTNGIGSYFGQTGQSTLIEALHRSGATTSNSPLSSAEFMEALGRLPLMFAPGSHWLYHLGLEVAGVLVERVAGMRLGRFMQVRLFEPLGLRDTGFHVGPEQKDRLAKVYANPEPGQFVDVTDREPDATRAPAMDHGGGGLISSADDLARIARLFLDGGMSEGKQILAPSSVTEMMRNQVSAKAQQRSPVFPGFWQQHDFGLGVCIAKAPNHVSSSTGRVGWWGRTGTALFADPGKDVALVSLTQRLIQRLDDSGNADSFMHAVLDR